MSNLKTGNLFVQADENFLHFSDADGGYDHIEMSISKDSLEAMRDYFDALLAERYQPAPEVKG